VSPEGTRGFLEKVEKFILNNLFLIAVFLVKDIHKLYYNNDYSTIVKTYLRHAIFYDCSEIAISMSKTKKKNKIGE